MRALTVRQPWAWAIAFAGKNVENRSWTTHYRGPLAIHAGLGCDDLDDLPRGLRLPAEEQLTRGAIIALADLVDIRENVRSKWFSGPYGWILENVRPLHRPVKTKGRLGLWTPTPSQIRSIRARV